MNRRDVLRISAALGALAAVPFSALRGRSGGHGPDGSARANPLRPPAEGGIPVAFLVSEGAVVIDFCGPWEVFQDAVTSRHEDAFHLYTVAESREPIRGSGGLKIVPDHT